MKSEMTINKKISAKPAFKRELISLLTVAPFILPGLVLVCLFIIYPMLVNIQISFSDYKIVDGTKQFVGLKNYLELFNEPQGRFWFAYRNNFLYAVVTTPFILFFGLFFAVLINNLRSGRIFFRALFYLPVITSWVIVGLVFLYLFNANERGLVNYILVDILHILPGYVSWLQNEWSGNLVIWIMGIWKNIGWCLIIYLAALQGIPAELYEASSVEGANSVKKFFKITIPLLTSNTNFIAVNLIIGAFNVFLQVFILTKGNPSGRTSVLQYLLYDRSFNLFKFGEGAAIGVMTALTVLTITIILNKISRADDR